MPTQSEQFPPRRSLPDSRGGVPAASSDELAIRAVGSGAERAIAGAQRTYLLPGFGIPDFGGTIFTRGQNEAASRTPRRAQNRSTMPLQHVAHLSGCRIPDARCSIRASRDDLLTIGAVRCADDSSRMTA